jgi:DNA-binding phage protein
MSRKATSATGQLRKAIASAEKEGMTRSKIAATAGMPRSQVKRVADGDTIPTMETAERIAKAVNHQIIVVPMSKNGRNVAK